MNCYQWLCLFLFAFSPEPSWGGGCAATPCCSQHTCANRSRSHGSALIPAVSFHSCRGKISSHPYPGSLSVFSMCGKTRSPSTEQVPELLLRSNSRSCHVLTFPPINLLLIKDCINPAVLPLSIPCLHRLQCPNPSVCSQDRLPAVQFHKRTKCGCAQGHVSTSLWFCTNFKKI